MDREEYYYQQGLHFSSRKEYEKAVIYFTQAIAMSLQNPVYYFSRGTIYTELERYSDALEDLHFALILTAQLTKSEQSAELYGVIYLEISRLHTASGQLHTARYYALLAQHAGKPEGTDIHKQLWERIVRATPPNDVSGFLPGFLNLLWKADTFEEMQELTKANPLLKTPDAIEMLISIICFQTPPHLKRALELRLSWLKELEKSLGSH